jgi:uncharacterized membrane protein
MKKKKKNTVYLVTIVLSVLFLFIGNMVATQDLTIFDDTEDQQIVKAEVQEIESRNVDEFDHEDGTSFENVQIVFQAKILKGEDKGQTVTAVQIFDAFSFPGTPEVQQGDKILIIYTPI